MSRDMSYLCCSDEYLEADSEDEFAYEEVHKRCCKHWLHFDPYSSLQVPVEEAPESSGIVFHSCKYLHHADTFSIPLGEEDLETALQNAQIAQQPPVSVSVYLAGVLSYSPCQQGPLLSEQSPRPPHPEVVEDFVRNFLVQMGMSRTAECFQAEWYELTQTGRNERLQSQLLPDIYSQ